MWNLIAGGLENEEQAKTYCESINKYFPHIKAEIQNVMGRWEILTLSQDRVLHAMCLQLITLNGIPDGWDKPSDILNHILTAFEKGVYSKEEAIEFIILRLGVTY